MDLRAQFAHPQGITGSLIGHLMALKNRTRSEWVLSLLDLKPQERVLEIGSGSGADLRRVRRTVAYAAGVDHSETMVHQARHRNLWDVHTGAVEVKLGTAERLPFPQQSFDAVFSINVAQFWRDPAACIREAARVLRPGGRLVIAVQPRNPGATRGTTERTGEALLAAMRGAGLQHVRLEIADLQPVPVACVIGFTPVAAAAI